ncbi:glycosyltransferase family 2 protein [Nocardioides lianchengensis]|uniref:glycosyltransferase family 2 protein n=1 Tax=Nocardioides lianchengensis TaxID=1045774 RepID=UPI000B81F81B|nr:glycosyltransferase family 2 protein [Nocardioides lianchengensis]NYG08806.1 GT2 family glycosyltransferase [Nocardioides lianchengensis]
MPGPRSVAVLLVSHDGARWLPAVIDGIRSQTAPVERVVAIDTGSKDESPGLLDLAFDDVRRVGGATSYPEAVRLGLDALGPDGPEWVWLLHDDSNPDPTCLEALLAAADEDPGADLLGPKLREWPSLRRLLELGVTISATGRRETGLERGEYDQGQHDEVRTVLAVNTAGLLVRRSVLEGLGGLDPQLPMFGNDLDLGWRAAQAGHRTLIVPQAVVFHAEAAHRGVRRTPLTGRHTHYQERRAAIWTLLANAPGRALPFQVVRLALGTVLRMVGFLLVRSVGQALDELAALVSVYSHPGDLRAARRARRAGRVADHDQVRRLLAPWWLPYRHGLDFLGDLLAAATDQAADVAERRRAAQAEADPSSFAARRVAVDDEDALGEDTGLVARFFTNPVALALTLFVVVVLVAARAVLGEVSGGGLSPAPDAARDWWDLHLTTWQPLGTGTAVPAPGYVLPLALLATLLLGSPASAVTALLVLAVPFALWGAWRLLRVVGRLVSPRGAPRWLILWGATTYSLVPVTSGAWGDGRLGLVVAAALLPWLAHAALGFADPDADRRWRAAWRTGLLLALVTSFAPVAWLLAVVVGLVVVATATAVVRSAVRDRSVWGPPATAVGIVPVLLAPWWLPAVLEHAAEGLLLDAGRLPGLTASGVDLLAGRFHELGAPAWAGLVLPVLAALAVLPRATRIPVLVCWVVALVAAATTAVLSLVTLDLAAVSVPAATGLPLLVLQGVLVVAATLGGQGLVLAARRDGWPTVLRGLTVLLAAGAAVVPLVGLGWFAAGHDELAGDADDGIPAYMVQSSETGPEHGILVVRGDVATGLDYVVRRDDGVTLGEDEVLALTAEDTELTRVVRTLVSRPTDAEVSALADRGIEYVVLPSPADPEIAGSLDATAGLVQASAENRSTRAWRVEQPLDPDAVDGPRSWLRVVLLVVQGLAVLVVLVLCAPTTDRRRQP